MSTATTFIDTGRFAEFMRQEMKEGMIQACEPVIQEAMKQIEVKLREKVGSIVIGLIKEDFNVMRDGRDICIRVQHREVK